jgi:hypothetical protein
MHHAALPHGAPGRSPSRHGSRAPRRAVTRGQPRRGWSSPPRNLGGWPRRPAAGAARRSPLRRRVGFRSGVHRPADSGPGSSPGRLRRAGPLSRSSSDAWRCRSRRPPGARTGRDCSATSNANSTTAGSMTATCSHSRSCSTPSTRRSVAESAPAKFSPQRRRGPTDRGDVPGDGGDRARCQRHPREAVTPAQRPSQATGRRVSRKLQVVTPRLSPTGRNWRLLHGRSAPAVGVRTATRSEEKR